MSDIIPEGILYGNLGVGSGTTNYNDLDNKPQINAVTLQGNKTASELGLVGTADIPVTSVNGETGAVVLDGTDIEYSSGVSVNSQIDTLMDYIPVYGNTASGSIATFDTSLALPLQDCTIAINAVQEGTGTPSPQNIRNIVGFTGANIHVADNETPHVIDNVTAITWQTEAGTVYGGSLDVTSGVLTVTHAFIEYDGSSDETFQYNSAYDGFRIKIDDAGIFGIPSVELLSNIFVGANRRGEVTTPNFAICTYSGTTTDDGKYIFFCGTGMTDVATFKTWLSSNNTQVVYPLATPVTYQLTPTQISAIVGTNNVFTDTNGNTSVVFACSLKDYIDSQ